MDADRFYPGVSLAKLFPRSRFHYSHDIRTSSCCTDYARCRKGDLFVATVQADQDGHDYAHDAVRNGAAAIMTERLLPIDIPQCVVENTTSALGKLCHRLAGTPSQALPVIGIAGQCGKTATQLLVNGVLESNGARPAVFGTQSFSDGFETLPRRSRSTSATRYAQWLGNIVANDCTHAITELPRQDVAKRAFDGVTLSALLLTGLTSPTHRGTKPSPRVEAYLHRILDLLPEGQTIIANVDCPLVRHITQHIDRPVLTVSTHQQADVTARRLEQFPSEQTFLLETGSDTVAVRTKVIGDAHLRHCMLAAAFGLAMELSPRMIIEGLESVDSIRGQLERVDCGQPFSVFVDSASTSVDLHQALKTVCSVTRGRVFCVYGEGKSAQSELRSRRGSIVEKHTQFGIITSDNPQEPEPVQATHDVLDGYQSPARAHVMPNRVHAIEWALSQAEAGDSVLIVGPHNRQLERAENGYRFDVDVAKFWLIEKADHIRDWLLQSRPGD